MRTQDNEPGFWRLAGKDTLLSAALVGGFFLVTEHRALDFGILPFLLVLAWPLMRLFTRDGKNHGRRKPGRYPSEDDV